MAQSNLNMKGKHATILMVDDDDSIRSLLTRNWVMRDILLNRRPMEKKRWQVYVIIGPTSLSWMS